VLHEPSSCSWDQTEVDPARDQEDPQPSDPHAASPDSGKKKIEKLRIWNKREN